MNKNKRRLNKLASVAPKLPGDFMNHLWFREIARVHGTKLAMKMALDAAKCASFRPERRRRPIEVVIWVDTGYEWEWLVM